MKPIGFTAYSMHKKGPLAPRVPLQSPKLGSSLRIFPQLCAIQSRFRAMPLQPQFLARLGEAAFQIAVRLRLKRLRAGEQLHV